MKTTNKFQWMAALVMGMAMTCVTMTSCSKVDNPADYGEVIENENGKEDISFDIPGDVPVVGTQVGGYIYAVKVLGCKNKGAIEELASSYKKEGWKVIEKDLNLGAAGKYIYLAVKTCTLNSIEQGTAITDFYLADDNNADLNKGILYKDGKKYVEASYDGDSNFDGDLNAGADGATIRLFYTKDNFSDQRAVTLVYFNNESDGALGVNASGEGYNLNYKTKKKGETIYMHVDTKANVARWHLSSLSSTECELKGFVGDKESVTSISLPLVFDNLKVVAYTDVHTLKNLEEMNFYQRSTIDYVPSVSGCSKFKRINVINDAGNIMNANTLHRNITKLNRGAFAHTALETIILPNVTEVEDGISAGTFEGCDSLKSVKFHQLAYVGEHAFRNIQSKQCIVTYPMAELKYWKWNKAAVEYSPNLIVRGSHEFYYKNNQYKTNAPIYLGWCGEQSWKDYQTPCSVLYWTANTKTPTKAKLTISCSDFYWRIYPEYQAIVNHKWEELTDILVDEVVFERIYEVKESEFEGNRNISIIHFYPGIKRIGKRAFKDCASLNKIHFHGSQTEWDAVEKGDDWMAGVNPSCQVKFEK